MNWQWKMHLRYEQFTAPHTLPHSKHTWTPVCEGSSSRGSCRGCVDICMCTEWQANSLYNYTTWHTPTCTPGLGSASALHLSALAAARALLSVENSRKPVIKSVISYVQRGVMTERTIRRVYDIKPLTFARQNSGKLLTLSLLPMILCAIVRFLESANLCADYTSVLMRIL